MSPFVAQIDRFVRWFFNVSPLTTSIEPQPPIERPKRRAASSASRRARAASPKDRRDRAADRRETGAARSARAGSNGDKEQA